jgi:hypothetical protein
MQLKNFLSALLILLAVLAGHTSWSQETIRQQPCVNESYKPIIDSVKQLYKEKGYSLLREASMMMESDFEMPVVVPLTGKMIYQFIFIGDPGSRLYEVRMYDYNEKQVFYKKHLWGDVDGNVISFEYAPQFTEYHMIKAVQSHKTKKKGLCGYVMMFRRNGM